MHQRRELHHILHGEQARAEHRPYIDGGDVGDGSSHPIGADVSAQVRRAEAGGIVSGEAAQLPVGQAGGQPLDSALRTDFESRFGRNFSQVRVHTGVDAMISAKQLNAQAYTYGNDIVFGAGQYQPGSGDGRKLVAHELAHVVQQRAGHGGDKDTIRRRRCTSVDAPDAIIDQHTANPGRIDAPGEMVDFEVSFNCEVRGLSSDIESEAGRSLGMRTYPDHSAFPRDRYTRRWDGKKLYTGIGTYMVDDGRYRQRLADVLYAYRYDRATGRSENLYATGAKLASDGVEVATRRGAFSNYHSNHYSDANVETVARIIRSEMGIGNNDEQRAVAWAVRNQMVRLNTIDATVAQTHFGDAHGQAATEDARNLAQEVLSVDMGHDTSGGAIKWFSPRSMPSEGQSCDGYDCGGGVITIADDAGVNRRIYAPSFHRSMTYAPVAGVRGWYVRFYRLA